VAVEDMVCRTSGCGGEGERGGVATVAEVASGESGGTRPDGTIWVASEEGDTRKEPLERECRTSGSDGMVLLSDGAGVDGSPDCKDGRRAVRSAKSLRATATKCGQGCGAAEQVGGHLKS
jgi:hypothetical protein